MNVGVNEEGRSLVQTWASSASSIVRGKLESVFSFTLTRNVDTNEHSDSSTTRNQSQESESESGRQTSSSPSMIINNMDSENRITYPVSSSIDLNLLMPPDSLSPRVPRKLSSTILERILDSNELNVSICLDNVQASPTKDPPFVNTPRVKNTTLSDSSLKPDTLKNVGGRMLVCAAEQKLSKDTNGAAQQMKIVAEEIDCDPGMIFNATLDDAASKNDFIKCPGVSRRKLSNKITVKDGKRKRATTCIQSSCCYKAKTIFAGVSVNLGSDHYSSVSAAAAIDIANRLYWGDENNRPQNVLSEDEVLKALEVAGARIKRNPARFSSTPFNQHKKQRIETLVEDALSCIGGRDATLIDILDELQQDTEESESQQQHKRCKEGESDKHRVERSQLSYAGQHVIYDIDDEGIFSLKIDET